MRWGQTRRRRAELGGVCAAQLPETACRHGPAHSHAHLCARSRIEGDIGQQMAKMVVVEYLDLDIIDRKK